MMSTAEFMNAKAAVTAPVRVTDGGRMIARGAQRVLGTALALAALGLWLAPGASWENDVMLFKLILSLIALLAGFGLLQASSKPKTLEVEIDTIRREVRLMRPADDGSAALIERCAFADLSRAERLDNDIRLWGPSNNLLAEVSMTDRAVLSSLVAGLRDAGKLA
jgi:membrane protein implicated in regulation of membrane protease activity